MAGIEEMITTSKAQFAGRNTQQAIILSHSAPACNNAYQKNRQLIEFNFLDFFWTFEAVLF